MNDILVTGATGYIGSVVTSLLVEQGYSVVGLDNFSSSYPEAIHPDTVFYEGDVRDGELLKDIFDFHDIKFVFHFAAESIIGKSMTDPSLFFNNNVVGGIALLDTMREYGAKLIQSSTASSYGNPLYTPIDEDHPQNPVNSYGESKLILERIIKWYQKSYGLDYVLFRYFNAGGSLGHICEKRKEETRLLPTIVRCIKNNKVLKIFGNDYDTKDGTAIRDYVHVIDIANAHILAMNDFERIKNDTYNLGSAEGFSILEIVRMVENIAKKKVEFEFAERRPGDPPVLIASKEKTIKKLGWNPTNSNLKKIIEDSWENII